MREGIWIEGEPILNRIILVWTTRNVLYGPIAFANEASRSKYADIISTAGTMSHYLVIPKAPRHNNGDGQPDAVIPSDATKLTQLLAHRITKDSQ